MNENNKVENKSPKKPKIVGIKGPRVVRRAGIKLNFFNVLLMIGFGLAGYLAISSIFRPTPGNEIKFDEFVSGIINNKYSQVDIRDDGQAIAYEKYIDYAFIENKENVNITKENIKGTDFVENIETVSFEEFLKRIEPPQSPQEFIESIRDRKSSFKVDELIVGENFVLVKKANSEGGDLLIQNITEAEFKQKLSDQNKSISQITSNVSYLRSAGERRDISDIDSKIKIEKYSDVWITSEFVLTRVDKNKVQSFYTLTGPIDTDLISYLREQGYNLESGKIDFKTVSIPVLPWGDIIFFGALLLGLGALVVYFLRGIQGSGNSLMKFGQSKAGLFFGRKPEVTFKDVAGVDEAKEELKEVVMFLKTPQKFTKLGARIPKGILLVGTPGSGKTLLARAIAGEAGVPFFHTSGSEFEEMLVGAGASRVRDLFEKAKKASPAIIFIDEIDAVARKRGTTVQSSSTEQTLNQILVEMDGFEKNTNIIIIAATNRPDVLDPAILRPGRFDRRVVLDLPDIEGRIQILKIHASNKPLAKDVDLKNVAKRTVGFSGADIENMLNEAAIIAAKADRFEVTSHDIEEAATKVAVGPERKRKRTKDELKMTAYHEAGHAIIARLSPETDPVHRITIISRGMSLGSTMQLPQNDKMQQTKTELESKIKVLLGGRAAEEIIFNDITGGASNDIERATSISRNMIKLLGMSKKLGLVKYGQSNELQYLGYGYGEQRDYSEKTAELIDNEVRDIIQDAYGKVMDMLNENIELLHKLSEELLEKEVVEGEEFEELFKKYAKK